MIVCIPSKGRTNTKTHELFESAGYDVYHFVEPHEYDQYNVKNKINIQKSNQGITYVRNFMLDWCLEKGVESCWFSDDDIQGFGIYNGKTVKKDANILKDIEKVAEKLPFEIYGMNYVQYAWTEKKNYSINSKWCEVCVLMKVSKIKWRYRENTKEDRDFQMQTIQNGNGVLRFNRLWFSCPSIGANAGGLHEWYAEGNDAEAAKKMSLQWNPWIKAVNKKGRLDVKADIKGFAKSCGRDVR
tara:strand:+ start:392 stop:1117 length:726 start_codon:yes stop_codon:yes gene_type:complete